MVWLVSFCMFVGGVFVCGLSNESVLFDCDLWCEVVWFCLVCFVCAFDLFVCVCRVMCLAAVCVVHCVMRCAVLCVRLCLCLCFMCLCGLFVVHCVMLYGMLCCVCVLCVCVLLYCVYVFACLDCE